MFRCRTGVSIFFEFNRQFGDNFEPFVTLEALVPLNFTRRRVLAFVVYIFTCESVCWSQPSAEHWTISKVRTAWSLAAAEIRETETFHSLATASNVQGRRNISDTFHLAGWEGDKVSAFRVTFLQGDCSKRWRTIFISEKKGHGERQLAGRWRFSSPGHWNPQRHFKALKGQRLETFSETFVLAGECDADCWAPYGADMTAAGAVSSSTNLFWSFLVTWLTKGSSELLSSQFLILWLCNSFKSPRWDLMAFKSLKWKKNFFLQTRTESRPQRQEQLGRSAHQRSLVGRLRWPGHWIRVHVDRRLRRTRVAHSGSRQQRHLLQVRFWKFLFKFNWIPLLYTQSWNWNSGRVALIQWPQTIFRIAPKIVSFFRGIFIWVNGSGRSGEKVWPIFTIPVQRQ